MHLGYADYKTAFKETRSGYLFKQGKATGGVRLKLLTPEGNDFMVDGSVGYLNTQVVDGTCCFISGNMNSQSGQDLAKGAVWKIEYTEGKGFSILNVGTGKYLKDPNSPAKYDEPTYFTLCTLKEKTTGIDEVRSQKSEVRSGVYTLDGRRVNADDLRPGLYILNGKKVVVK